MVMVKPLIKVIIIFGDDGDGNGDDNTFTWSSAAPMVKAAFARILGCEAYLGDHTTALHVYAIEFSSKRFIDMMEGKASDEDDDDDTRDPLYHDDDDDDHATRDDLWYTQSPQHVQRWLNNLTTHQLSKLLLHEVFDLCLSCYYDYELIYALEYERPARNPKAFWNPAQFAAMFPPINATIMPERYVCKCISIYVIPYTRTHITLHCHFYRNSNNKNNNLINRPQIVRLAIRWMIQRILCYH
jgi:hypothetical protein